ncbi:hypothetical protein F511_20295 [Dorcoceras hygrometricum]|uniref:Uncharacterized protein n=1 Tax=Dorcoceras hygrometricum TaxID=472368 RepID=A0A2Z7CTP3_9LAMI|nr:hypothetical protein F511_20295 [Dorcoceras hygrometricum]
MSTMVNSTVACVWFAVACVWFSVACVWLFCAGASDWMTREFLRRIPVVSGHRLLRLRSVGLLSLRRFVSYPSLMQRRSWKRITETSPLFSLLASDPSLLGLVSCCIVAVVSYQDARASGNTALSSPCWDLLATMRRVVNYHSSWARQQQVELFDASGNPGFTAGRGFNPADGAPGGG